MKILNGFAGIGGNRAKWGDSHDITAVEYDNDIATVYAHLWQKDTVITSDAMEYLLHHIHEFDFLWLSPPCPSHSQVNSFLHAQGVRRFPDCQLLQLLLWLPEWTKRTKKRKAIAYCVENVEPYWWKYAKNRETTSPGRHWFWANFEIPKGLESIKMGRFDKLKNGQRGDKSDNLEALGFDLSGYKLKNKDKVLRNCVTPSIGVAILDAAENAHKEMNAQQKTLAL